MVGKGRFSGMKTVSTLHLGVLLLTVEQGDCWLDCFVRDVC